MSSTKEQAKFKKHYFTVCDFPKNPSQNHVASDEIERHTNLYCTDCDAFLCRFHDVYSLCVANTENAEKSKVSSRQTDYLLS